MKPVGIFGGTFDPVHIGHLITAQAVKEIRDLEKIVFIPAFISPHKVDYNNISAEHRLKMVQLSTEDIPYFEYSDIEIKRESVSYTIDTLRELKKKYDKIELIIGYDNIIDFNTWKEPDEILKLADLIVLRRKTSVQPVTIDKYFHSAIFVDTPAIEISSSEIRQRVAGNMPIDFLVHPKVKEYISEFNLYKRNNK
ncbi:MAG: nicotinate-nucleotide adenylyltransferase [Ignavibacteriaceae bacterium]|nr:nicotinate-nucleotide adenylyltransferase [Ignavibacteriaceae bacterium]